METAGTVEAPNSLDSFTEKQRGDWLLNGTPQPKDEAESATAEATSEPAKAESTAPATETGTKTQEPSRAERRKGELSAEIQGLLRKRAELRGEIEAADKTKPAEKTAAPAPAVVQQPTDGEPVAPDPENWTGTWEALEKAKIQYLKDLSAWLTKQPERDRVAAAKAADEANQQQVFETWKERRDAAIELNPEFADANDIVGRFLTAKGVAPLVIESEIGPEIVMHLYHLPKEEQERVAKLSPTALARELVRIEDRLAKADPAAEAAPAATPQPKITSAVKKPATELSGKSATNTVDDAEDALAKGDYERYARVMNARASKKS
jgi:hypothetical protein